MQQTCLDDVLMGNYSHLNDTESLTNLTNDAVGDLVAYKCEPFDCNAHGRCTDGRCVCNPGLIITINNISINIIKRQFIRWSNMARVITRAPYNVSCS